MQACLGVLHTIGVAPNSTCEFRFDAPYGELGKWMAKPESRKRSRSFNIQTPALSILNLKPASCSLQKLRRKSLKHKSLYPQSVFSSDDVSWLCL